MKIIPNYDFTTASGSFTPADEASFEEDVRTAINIFDATFTNDITLTLDIGFGSIGTETLVNGVPSITHRKMTATEGGLGAPNAVGLVTYSQLRTALLTNGQPGFFNAANLPAGDSINNMSNFWVTSSEAKALGLPLQRPGLVDGFIGINIKTDKGGFTPGPDRIAAILHEIGHVMGRHAGNVDFRSRPLPLDPNDDPPNPQDPISVSALDLVRFISPDNRLFDGNPNAPTPAYFSVDGGAKRVADWAAGISPDDFLRAPPLSPPTSKFTPNDPFNDVGHAGDTLAKLTTADVQLMEALGFRVAPTAVMMLRRASDGLYEIYNLGGNASSAGSQFGQVGTDWQFVTLGGFDDDSTSEMLLRDATSGGFEVYDITHDELTGVAFMGDVGLDWQFFGVGNFSSKPGETDIMLRNTGTGQDRGKFLIYNIKNDGITGTFQSPLTIGLNCQLAGIGNFSGRPGASDMILRDTNTGKLFLYNINNNQITFAREIGTVGLNCEFSGVGNFSSNPGESDVILRDTNTGKLFLYNIVNQITFAGEIGTVGLNWQFAGVAPIRVPGASDLVLRNANTGEFWVYNIANNQIMGNGSLATVGSEWQLGGFAPTSSNGFIGNSGGPLASGPQPSAGATSQLVQAMAGFGGGAAGTSATAPLGADTSQQAFLTTPQHA
jgi:hypothetical protein